MTRIVRPAVSLVAVLGLLLIPLVNLLQPASPAMASAAGSWAAATNLSNVDGYSKFPAIAVDARARYHLVWIDNADGGYALRYSRYDPAARSWSIPVSLVSDAAEGRPAIALDRSDRIHVAYLAAPPGSTFQIRYLVQEPGQTSWSTPLSLSSANESTTPTSWSAPALTVDSLDRVHAAWAGYSSGGVTQIVHRVRGNGTWGASLFVAGPTGRSDMPSLAAGSHGRVHLAWSGETDGAWDIWVADWSSTNQWSGIRNVSNTGAFAAYPSLVSDQNGVSGGPDTGDDLGLVWIDNVGGLWTVRYIARANGSWSATSPTNAVNLSGNAGWLSAPALYRDGEGNRHALWSSGSASNSTIVYRGLDGGAWSAPVSLPTVEPSAAASWGPAMVVNQYGQALAVWMKQLSGSNIDLIAAGATVPFPPVGVPTLIAPADGATVDSHPVFQWTAVPTASYYQLDLDTVPTFTSAGRISRITRNLALTLDTPLTGVAAGQTWYWRVSAVDPAGRTSTSTSRSIVASVSQTPVLYWPPDSWLYLVPSAPITASWSAVPNAATYFYEASDVPPSPWSLNGDGSFKYPVYTTTSVSNLISVGKSSPGGGPFVDGRTYYWHVAAVTSAGQRLPFSDARQFVKRWATAAPLSPLDVDVNIYHITLEWEPTHGAVRYEIEVYYFGAFPRAVYTTTVESATQHTIPRTLPDDQYSWRVRAIDIGGNPGPWSDFGSFLKSWDTRPVILVPAEPDQVVEVPYLAWTSVPHASRYSVQIQSTGDISPVIAIDADVTRTDFVPNLSYADKMAPGRYVYRIRAIDDGPNGNRLPGAQTVGTFHLITPTAFLTNQLTVRPYWPPDAVAHLADGTTVDVYTGTVPAVYWPPIPAAYTYDVAFYFDTEFNNIYRSGVGVGHQPGALENKDHYRSYYPSLAAYGEGLPDANVGVGYYVAAQWATEEDARSGFYTSEFNRYRFNLVTPAGPEIIQPARWDAITGTPTFQWTPLTKPEVRFQSGDIFGVYTIPSAYYYLQVASDPAFGEDSIVHFMKTDAPQYTPTVWQVPDGVYYWRVCSEEYPASGLCDQDVQNRRNWSEVRGFYQIAPQFFAPQLISPAIDEGTGATPIFTWRPVTSAVSYDIQIATGPNESDFVMPYDSASDLGLPGYVPADLVYPRGQLYWRVRARNARGVTSPWSAVARFNVGPQAPLLISPANGAELRPLEIPALFSWASVIGARSYRIEIADSATFDVVREALTTSALEFAPSFLAGYQDGQTYYWRVVPLGLGEVAGPPSALRSFVVRLPMIGAVPTPTATPTPGSGGSGSLPEATATPTPDRSYRAYFPYLRNGGLVGGW